VNALCTVLMSDVRGSSSAPMLVLIIVGNHVWLVITVSVSPSHTCDLPINHSLNNPSV